MLRDDGLTDAEGEVMDALCEAWEAFAGLPVEHPSEQDEFVAGVHRLQDILACRIARREFPAGWARFRDGVMVDGSV